MHDQSLESMKTLIHITDLHFGKLTPGAVERLEFQIGQIQPDMCIVSGDLTMRSRPREWKQARAFLDRLPVPYMVVPGNHDLPYFNLYERFQYPYRRFKKYINEDTDPTYVDDAMAIKGINTARSWVPHYMWKEGGISQTQVKEAESFFRSTLSRNIFRIAFAHHPFLPPPDKPRTYLVRNARAALQAFERTDVDLLLGGHLHLSYGGNITSFHTLINRSMICIQGASATSSRLRNKEPNSFSQIQLYENTIAAITWQWNQTDYIEIQKTVYRRTSGGWEPE